MNAQHVILAAEGPLESSVLQAIDTPGSGLQVVRRCADMPELLAAARAGLAELAVIVAELDGVDRQLIADVNRAGVQVLLLIDKSFHGDPLDFGAQAYVPAQVAPAEVTVELLSLHASREEFLAKQVLLGKRPDQSWDQALTQLTDRALPGSVNGSASGSGPGGVPAGMVESDKVTLPPPPPGFSVEELSEFVSNPLTTSVDAIDASTSYIPELPGSIVAVWGASGSPGRSTVATNLARALTQARADLPQKRGKSVGSAGQPGHWPCQVLLVDADTNAPALTQMLGVTEENSGLAALTRKAGRGELSTADFDRFGLPLHGQLQYLCGLSRPQRWRELPAANLELVLANARELYPWVVVDIANELGEESLGGYDAGPLRQQATNTVLRLADIVLIVGQADPVGLRRLLQQVELGQEQDWWAHTHKLLVINKLRVSAAGPNPQRSVQEILSDLAPSLPVVFLSDARTELDEALLQASFIAETAPRHRWTQEISALAGQLRQARSCRRPVTN